MGVADYALKGRNGLVEKVGDHFTIMMIVDYTWVSHALDYWLHILNVCKSNDLMCAMYDTFWQST